MPFKQPYNFAYPSQLAPPIQSSTFALIFGILLSDSKPYRFMINLQPPATPKETIASAATGITLMLAGAALFGGVALNSSLWSKAGLPIAAFFFFIGLCLVCLTQKVLYDKMNGRILKITSVFGCPIHTKKYRSSDFKRIVIDKIIFDGAPDGYELVLDGKTSLKITNAVTKDRMMPYALHLKEILDLPLEDWASRS